MPQPIIIDATTTPTIAPLRQTEPTAATTTSSSTQIPIVAPANNSTTESASDASTSAVAAAPALENAPEIPAGETTTTTNPQLSANVPELKSLQTPKLVDEAIPATENDNPLSTTDFYNVGNEVKITIPKGTKVGDFVFGEELSFTEVIDKDKIAKNGGTRMIILNADHTDDDDEIKQDGESRLKGITFTQKDKAGDIGCIIRPIINDEGKVVNYDIKLYLAPTKEEIRKNIRLGKQTQWKEIVLPDDKTEPGGFATGLSSVKEQLKQIAALDASSAAKSLIVNNLSDNDNIYQNDNDSDSNMSIKTHTNSLNQSKTAIDGAIKQSNDNSAVQKTVKEKLDKAIIVNNALVDIAIAHSSIEVIKKVADDVIEGNQASNNEEQKINIIQQTATKALDDANKTKQDVTESLTSYLEDEIKKTANDIDEFVKKFEQTLKICNTNAPTTLDSYLKNNEDLLKKSDQYSRLLSAQANLLIKVYKFNDINISVNDGTFNTEPLNNKSDIKEIFQKLGERLYKCNMIYNTLTLYIKRQEIQEQIKNLEFDNEGAMTPKSQKQWNSLDSLFYQLQAKKLEELDENVPEGMQSIVNLYNSIYNDLYTDFKKKDVYKLVTNLKTSLDNVPNLDELNEWKKTINDLEKTGSERKTALDQLLQASIDASSSEPENTAGIIKATPLAPVKAKELIKNHNKEITNYAKQTKNAYVEIDGAKIYNIALAYVKEEFNKDAPEKLSASQKKVAEKIKTFANINQDGTITSRDVKTYINSLIQTYKYSLNIWQDKNTNSAKTTKDLVESYIELLEAIHYVTSDSTLNSEIEIPDITPLSGEKNTWSVQMQFLSYINNGGLGTSLNSAILDACSGNCATISLYGNKQKEAIEKLGKIEFLTGEVDAVDLPKHKIATILFEMMNKDGNDTISKDEFLAFFLKKEYKEKIMSGVDDSKKEVLMTEYNNKIEDLWKSFNVTEGEGIRVNHLLTLVNNAQEIESGVLYIANILPPFGPLINKVGVEKAHTSYLNTTFNQTLNKLFDDSELTDNVTLPPNDVYTVKEQDTVIDFLGDVEQPQQGEESSYDPLRTGYEKLVDKIISTINTKNNNADDNEFISKDEFLSLFYTYIKQVAAQNQYNADKVETEISNWWDLMISDKDSITVESFRDKLIKILYSIDERDNKVGKITLNHLFDFFQNANTWKPFDERINELDLNASVSDDGSISTEPLLDIVLPNPAPIYLTNEVEPASYANGITSLEDIDEAEKKWKEMCLKDGTIKKEFVDVIEIRPKNDENNEEEKIGFKSYDNKSIITFGAVNLPSYVTMEEFIEIIRLYKKWENSNEACFTKDQFSLFIKIKEENANLFPTQYYRQSEMVKDTQEAESTDANPLSCLSLPDSANASNEETGSEEGDFSFDLESSNVADDSCVSANGEISASMFCSFDAPKVAAVENNQTSFISTPFWEFLPLMRFNIFRNEPPEYQIT